MTTRDKQKLIGNIKKLPQKYNEMLFLGLVVIAVFIPLYPKLPLSSVSGTYVAIRLEDILLLFLALAWFIVNITRFKKILKLNLTKSLLLFWFIGLISLFSGIYFTETASRGIGFLHFLRRIEYMVPLLIAATTIRNVTQAKIFLYAMLITTVIVAIYGFGQIYLNFPVISTTNREYSKGLILTLTPGSRPNATFAGHYDLAAYLSLALVFAGTMFFYYRKLKEKTIIVATSVISFALLGLTAARVSFAATILGVGLSFLLMRKRFLVVLLILASLAAVAAIPQLRHRLVATITVNLMGGGGPKYEPPPNTMNMFTPKADTVGDSSLSAKLGGRASSAPEFKRVEEATPSSESAMPAVPADIAPGEPVNITELGVYRSFNIRYDVEWPRAIRAFLKNPVLGTGYSSITIATDNDYLRVLGETGLLGFLSLVLVFFILIKRYIKSLFTLANFEKYFIIATLCSIAVMLSTAVLIDIFEASKIAILFWIILGVAWGIARNYEDSK